MVDGRTELGDGASRDELFLSGIVEGRTGMWRWIDEERQ